MKYLITVWNGHAWIVDNAYTAVAPSGPYDTDLAAIEAIQKATKEAIAEGFEPTYVTERTRIVEIANYPTEVPNQG